MKKFTLIELLIVVAIIGILFSMLMPSLAKAREKAENAVCKSNMKQIGTASINYVSSNDEVFVPGWSGENWNCISWDDYLGEYLGRPLTLAQKKKEWINKTDSSSPINGVFLCPSDKIPLDSTFPDGYRRTYVMNAGFFEAGVGFMGVGWRVADESKLLNIGEIASDTMIFTERPHTRNRLGKEGFCLIYGPEEQVDAASYHHGALQYNYLKIDNSVTTQSYLANLGGGTVAMPLGMWTRAKED